MEINIIGTFVPSLMQLDKRSNGDKSEQMQSQGK
jgi:hypothetical protein